MTFPLPSLVAVSAANPWTYILFGVIGFAFGYTLEMSGFGDSRKLAAQFYFTELTVLKVMFTAIVTAMVLLFGAVGLGILDFSQVWVNPTYLWSGLVGGLIMGVGFIIGGFCPTTSLASASTGKIDGMMFMLGGFVGAALFAESEPLFTNWYNNAGYFGRVTLDEVFGISKGAVVVLVILMALFMFWGSEQLERIFGKKDLSKEPKIRVAGAAVLAVMAFAVFFIGSPSLEDKYNKLTFTRTETIEQLNADPIVETKIYTADEMLSNRLVFVSPAEAFKTKYAQTVNPVYLDVRPEADFNLYHLEDAVNVPLDRLTEVIPVLLTEPPANTVYILMSNDEAAAVQAWKTLVASSVPNVYILEGGINNWIAFFGKDDKALQPNPNAGDDQLGYTFPAALGSRYDSCSPNPQEYEELDFEAKIKLQLKRDKSGGGCG
ncbi:MAG TPA: YeeE/YedE thiosulfate transporter family protein [Anaerolineales bacterium]|nr:YeeE/YedE thiosulfate transporter family protein [Anaerolineales bacterium]HMV95596.1 YeeE/YedE thiosulfate transporter family protein [Anaerolineales bacterium]HMX18339.1 YeeE/YedE thiosulfate transporter family protein [Anaerolineales bacterium]HND92618.1 YeeE/YedE thiosulfate transporter family protein [Anaerolineales bacterium]HNF35779.1 YeeE/YedE thiosulfate transporter family protein [Anaerolineales bacterium]